MTSAIITIITSINFTLHHRLDDFSGFCGSFILEISSSFSLKKQSSPIV